MSAIKYTERGFAHPVQYYDVHLYYHVDQPESHGSAKELHAQLKALFPEMPIYPMVDRQVGPHTRPMFETHLMNPDMFGRVLSWLCVHRRDHSILVHPNTPNMLEDHTHNAIWLGPQLPLKLEIFSQHH